jgi:hypothetical protein
MRRALLLLALLALGSARATAAPRHQGGLSGERDFWPWLLDPDGPEIDAALTAAQRNLEAATELGQRDPERRGQLLGDARAMLRYALRLDDARPRVHLWLGLVESERGDADAARRHLRRYMADSRPSSILGEGRLALAILDARAGHHRAARSQLEHALAGRWHTHRLRTHALIALAHLLMDEGDLRDAIDLLRHEEVYGRFGGSRSELVAFTLAMAYDRSEEIARAHATLAQLASSGPLQPSAALVDGLGHALPLAIPADRFYLAALAAEAAERWTDAEAAWRRYMDAPGAPYRRRAAQHLARLQHLLDSRSGHRP